MVFEYSVGGKSVQLEADPNLVGIRYSEPALHSFRAQFSEKIGADFESRFEIPNERYTVLKTPAVAPSSVTDRLNSELKINSAGISRTAPVFKIGSTRVLATDRILLGLHDPNEPVASLLRGINYTDIKSRGFGEYTVTLAPDADPLAISKQLESAQRFSYVEPDFVNVGNAPMGPSKKLQANDQQNNPSSYTASPDQNIDRTLRANISSSLNFNKDEGKGVAPFDTNDVTARTVDVVAIGLTANTFLPAQYAISRTKADEAWKLTTGSASVRIAILDEGVDTKHPDLRNAVVGSYDASDNDEFQEPNSWDGHGTACAGLAAAVPHDSEGVRGIGWGCSILAVRIAYSERPHGPWATTNGEIASAIDWCWRNKADVLSNSWGGGAPSNAIVNAFDRARAQGREGKGCVIVVAAGNDQGPVSFPANLPGVICVAASNERDEIKTTSSSDGENWWGSNFGPEVTVAAPGVHNFTTDITGASGYNPTGDYFASFNGTSSATPLVAGACGLVLSANVDLHGDSVAEILRNTADKVGALHYNEGRNDQFGYGRINVLRAVQAAISL